MGIFREIVGLISQSVWENGVYSIEQCNGPSGTQFYVWFWRGDQLVRTFIGEFHLGRHFPDGEIHALSNVLSLFNGSCRPLCLPGGSATLSSMVDEVYPDGPTRIFGLFFDHGTLTTYIDEAAIPFITPVGVHALIDYLLLRIRTARPCPWLRDFPSLDSVCMLTYCVLFPLFSLYYVIHLFRLFPRSPSRTTKSLHFWVPSQRTGSEY